ncbi:hypothetical protein GSI_02284 [Ganoderma sinense ZZ0214-1]|uniref:Tudor domain-containing protein n=1 Tax=Ganoderma sinense ZZ0214-1 TaxID=1077348 RepID=A0A2G8SP53_9APHY|nr:hypothetical protein GSI_02284 [Ganoderma sinense ZZ0214-1]
MLTRPRPRQARPDVDPIHIPATAQTSPTFDVGQHVGVQLRQYIWVPGTIVEAEYNTQYGCVLYTIQYVAANGCRLKERFLPKDVRDYE